MHFHFSGTYGTYPEVLTDLTACLAAYQTTRGALIFTRTAYVAVPSYTMRQRKNFPARACVFPSVGLLCTRFLLASPAAVVGFTTVDIALPANRPAAGTLAEASASRQRYGHKSSVHAAIISGVSPSSSEESCVSGVSDQGGDRRRKGGLRTTRGAVSGSTNTNDGNRFERFASFLLETQKAICREAEASDGVGRFCSDRWQRDDPSEGFGITRVLEDGDLLEKAACSVSVVHGVLTPERAKAMTSRGRAGIDSAGGQKYSAASMSLVFHTASPLVPTFRADVRYLKVADEGWFGGGADLTPYYLKDDDVEGFHRFYKDICDRYDAQAYPRFKRWADEYFYIPMRKEHRGVGGIFFDDLERLGQGEQEKDAEAFVRDVALGFMPSFLPIAERRGRQPFTDGQRQWQLLRRGRYLEFNLLYDRGVKFGLSGGRVESIMVSAPPLVAWKYNRVPDTGTEEDRLLEVLREPRDWVS